MNGLKRNSLAALFCTVILLPFALAFAKTPVRVGAYEFPPYVQLQQDQISGLTIELIKQLNQLQQDYHFELVMTTAVRRHQDFQQGLFDALFFEDMHWGWQQRGIILQQSPPFAQDDEVFIALRSYAKSQRWFDDLSGKSIAGILGYHYPIADYQTDPNILTNHYLLIPISDHYTNIELVLKQRTEMAIVARSFLSQYLAANPQYREQLLISERVDQSYQHRLLLHPEHPLQIATLYLWVLQLVQQPDLRHTFSQHGLQLLQPEREN